jgi:hypothetical protein
VYSIALKSIISLSVSRTHAPWVFSRLYRNYKFLRDRRILMKIVSEQARVRCIGSLLCYSLFNREGDGGDRIGRVAMDNLGLFWNTLNVRGKLPPVKVKIFGILIFPG